MRFEAHPVLLVRTNVSDVPRPEPALLWKPITIPPNGQRSLIGLPVHRVVVEPFNGDPIVLPVGWRGTESFTKAVVHSPGIQALPESHKALFVHPPWFEGHSGMLCIEMPIALPETTPLHFDCFLAIQQQAASEPPSDGVTFRVYVAPLDAAPGRIRRIAI